jgi:diguanylate cyclase (GGDEF)-like protein
VFRLNVEYEEISRSTETIVTAFSNLELSPWNARKWPTWLVLSLSLCFLAGVDLIDDLTGPAIQLSVLLLVPVCLSTWYAGLREGIFMAVLGALSHLIDPLIYPMFFPKIEIVYWNMLVLLVFFSAFSYLLSRLKRELNHVRQLIQTDNLTGLLNAGAFYEAAEREKSRALRYGHPFTVCFMDLDNFKEVNDTLGHQAGSELLKMMADLLVKNVRKTDLVARLGGDEFAIFFPEAGMETASGLVSKIHRLLAEQFSRKGTGVTSSIGLVTCAGTTWPFQEVLHRADQLMYEAKKSGKDQIVSEVIGMEVAGRPKAKVM